MTLHRPLHLEGLVTLSGRLLDEPLQRALSPIPKLPRGLTSGTEGGVCVTTVAGIVGGTAAMGADVTVVGSVGTIDAVDILGDALTGDAAGGPRTGGEAGGAQIGYVGGGAEARVGASVMCTGVAMAGTSAGISIYIYFAVAWWADNPVPP